MKLLDRMTTRHIVLSIVCASLGFVRMGPIGVIIGLGLGVAIAEITHMIDAMKK